MISFRSILKKIRDYNASIGYLLCFMGAMFVAACMLQTNDVVPTKEEGENVISINLSTFVPPTPPPPVPQKKVKKTVKKYKPKKVEPRPVPVETPVEVVEEVQQFEEVQEEVAEVVPEPNTEAQTEVAIKTLRSIDGIDDPYLREIRNQIERFNKYPRSAYNRRLSGEVTVKFLIRGDGSVTEIEIVNSSRYTSLDNAALKAVETASAHFPKPRESVYILLPISYSLQFR